MDRHTERPRWAQLTYASFDPGNGSGGWQVKEQRGELEARELRELSAHLVTAFESHQALPEYPTPGDIAAQPRRCAYLVAHGAGLAQGTGPTSSVTAGCFMHAVQAGADSTGRPGNVFSHVLLDRRPSEAEPAWRPIDAWRSFDLLTPYGAEEVLAATLTPGERLTPSGLVDRDLVLDFVFDPGTWRMGLLLVLLDAVHEALHGGRRVVLVTASADAAAMWVAAVSACMSAGTARAFSWSLYERAGRLAAVFDRGVHLACVPTADAVFLDPDEPGVILLDEQEVPAIGELGGAPHRTRMGQQLHVTPWSETVQRLLVDAPTGAGLLAMQDTAAARAGDWGLEPQWPLAIGALVAGERDAVITRIAADFAPRGGLDDAELAGALQAAITAGVAPGPAAAWTAWSESPTGSSAAGYLAGEYLVRAFADRAWLTRAGGVPAPMGGAASAVGPSVRAALRTVLIDAPPAVVLRAVDLAGRAGLLADAEAQSVVERAIAESVAPQLLVDAEERANDDKPSAAAEPAAFLREVGLVSAPVHTELVPQALHQLLAEWPSAVPSPLAVSWLGAHGPGRRLLSLAERGDTHLDALDRALAALAVHGERPPAGLAALLLASQFDRYGSWHDIPEAERLVTPTNLWRVPEIVALERRFPGMLPEGFLTPHLACAPWSPELAELASLVAERWEVHPEAAIARLRLDAAELGERLPSTSPRETLRLVEELGQRFPEHLDRTGFAPAVLEAALSQVATDGVASSWPVKRLRAIAAAAADAAARELAVESVFRRLDELEPDAATEQLVRLGLVGLAASVDDVPDPLWSSRRLAEAFDDTPGQLTDGIVTQAIDQRITSVDRLRTLMAERVGELVPGLPTAEVQRLVGDWGKLVSPSGRGDGWLRARRTRESKES